MIMKQNKLFVWIAMGLSLFACNDDLDGNGQDKNKAEEGTTYVAFSLDFKGVNSRVTTTEPGTDKEQGITDAFVMLVDGTTITKVVSMTTTAGNDRYDTDKKKFLMTTTAGPHDFYAVVNPETAPKKNDDITKYFNEATSLTIDAVAKDKFMMSSVKKETFYVVDGVTEQQALDGNSNSFQVDVERVSAKVTVICENVTLEGNAEGKISNTETVFNLRNIAEKTCRMAQTSPITEIGNQTYNDKKESVAVCFETTEGDANIWNSATPAYCLENLHTNYKQGNTTYITLSTKFIPAKVVDCADEVKSLKNNTTDAASFYVVTQGELAGNYILAADLATYRTNAGDNTKFPGGVEALSGEYENGICWFGPIWVGQEDGNPAEAPIHRNTWYNLSITGIKLPGSPEEPKITPTDPLNPDTNVAITLNVMPWNFIDREIKLQ